MTMPKNEKWVYRDGKLKEKVTTRTDSKGNRESVRQKAYSGPLGGRHATSVTSRTKYTKETKLERRASRQYLKRVHLAFDHANV